MNERDTHDRTGPAASTDGTERRQGDRRSAQADRRFWRALTTERRASERRRPLPAIDRSAVRTRLYLAGAVDEAASDAQRAVADDAPDDVAASAVADGAAASPAPSADRAHGRASVPSPAGAVPPPRSHETELAESRRRARLKAMLDRAEARQRQSEQRRGERTRFAAGLSVRIAHGPHAGLRGTVIDADYITARALVRFAADEDGAWIGFKDLIASVSAPSP